MPARPDDGAPAHGGLATLREHYRGGKAARLAEFGAARPTATAAARLIRSLARHVDATLAALWADTGMPPGAALVAVGGYGRGELLPCSDIDIMILLPQTEAEVVAVTATTLLNGTLPRVLAAVRADAFLMMLGPSTPLTPALFDLGFDLLCGTVIEDPPAVIRAVEQGAVTRQITGVRRVSLWRGDGSA